MQTHPYRHIRFKEAHKNIKILTHTLEMGDISSFVKIVEQEAMAIHAMMMTSDPYFLLLHPNTLKIIENIIKFRKNSNLPICFTLDAGPNIHLLYPQNIKDEVKIFINEELIVFCDGKAVIYDEVGKGPVKLL